MGTRGTFGFRIDGEDKLTYNHFDSYPEGLGKTIVEFVHSVKSWDTVKEQVRALRDISNTKPTQEDIEACASVTDLSVSNQSTEDWYCLLRNTQGNPNAILQVGRYEGANEFINDSLFCEYGYIVNLDDMTLELYEGFQQKKHNKGRYSKNNPEKSGSGNTYYPSALVGTFPLDEIPVNWDKVAFGTYDDDGNKLTAEKPIYDGKEPEPVKTPKKKRRIRIQFTTPEILATVKVLRSIVSAPEVESVVEKFESQLKKEGIFV